MGTRSMVFVIDDFIDNRIPAVQIYSQFDGYPKGMGKTLYDFFVDQKLVNGFSERHINISNGMEDLAAKIVTYIKSPFPTGNIYLYPVTRLPEHGQSFDDYVREYMLEFARDCGCEYIYIVRDIGGVLNIQVWDTGPEPLFTGPVKEMKDKFGFEEA